MVDLLAQPRIATQAPDVVTTSFQHADRTWRLDEGMNIAAVDGPGGRVDAVLLDRDRLTVTHLILIPRGPLSLPHLVPAEAMDLDGARPVLTWSRRRLLEAPVPRRACLVGSATFATAEPGAEVGVIRSFAATDVCDWGPGGATGWIVHYDVIPAGAVEIRHASRIETRDEFEAGRVGGFLVDKHSREVIAVIVERGHLWRRRWAVVPAEFLASVGTDRIRLALPLDQSITTRTSAPRRSSRRSASGHAGRSSTVLGG